MCADPIPSTLPMPPTCKGPVCTAVPGARELTPAAFMSVFMVVRSRESALMKWGCSKTWEWGDVSAMNCVSGPGAATSPMPGQTPSPGPAGSARSRWWFQGPLWGWLRPSTAAEGLRSGPGCARRWVGPLAGQAAAVGCSLEVYLQR